MNLSTRLFALVILTLLPIIGIQVYDELDLRSRRVEEGKDQALRLVRLVAQEQSKVIEGAHQLLTALGQLPAVHGDDVAACNTLLEGLAHSYPQYVGFISINRIGQPVCASQPTDPARFLGKQSYFIEATATHAFAMGDYEPDPTTGRGVIHLAQPYYDTAGMVSGVVAASLSIDWLNSEIARNVLPPKATISVVDRQGTILARWPNHEKFVGTRITPSSHTTLLTGGEGFNEATGFDGIVRYYAYTPMPGGPGGLTFSVGLDKWELLRGSEAENLRDVVVISGSLLLALVLAGIGARVFVSRPVGVLLDAAESVRRGNHQARVPFGEARSEFGRLGVAFNAMAQAIGWREHELE